MTSKPENFSMLEPTTWSLKVGNKNKVDIIDKGIVQIHTTIGVKYIFDVLLVLKLIKTYLLWVNWCKIVTLCYSNKRSCMVTGANGHDLFEVKIRNKCFPLNWNLIIK